MSREQHGVKPTIPMRHPVFRRRDFHSGFRMELGNLIGDAKGKGARATTRGRKYKCTNQAQTASW